MFAADLRFLEEMYNRINEDEATVKVNCPECGANFDKEFGRLGE
jgi:ssDNA-binding Zn-finger/Zn-ribbon topoisomerase 1